MPCVFHCKVSVTFAMLSSAFLQNLTDSSLKRVIQYMRSAKLIEIQQYPLEDLDPSAGPCVYKKGDLNSNLKLSHSEADFKVHFKLSNLKCVIFQGIKSLCAV